MAASTAAKENMDTLLDLVTNRDVISFVLLAVLVLAD